MKTFSGQFEEFASKKDPEEKYNYYNTATCACAQFCEFMGMKYSDTHMGILEVIASEYPHNFGALTERLHNLNTGYRNIINE